MHLSSRWGVDVVFEVGVFQIGINVMYDLFIYDWILIWSVGTRTKDYRQVAGVDPMDWHWFHAVDFIFSRSYVQVVQIFQIMCYQRAGIIDAV